MPIDNLASPATPETRLSVGSSLLDVEFVSLELARCLPVSRCGHFVEIWAKNGRRSVLDFCFAVRVLENESEFQTQAHEAAAT